MKFLKLAGVSVNQTPLDFQGNTQRMVQAIRAARSEGIHLLCFPELCISGYGCEDTFFSNYVLEESLSMLNKVVDSTKDMWVTVGLPMAFEHCLYNVVAVIFNKKILGFVAKQELPGDGIYYEPRWFKPWQAGRAVDYIMDGVSYPFGDLIFEVGGVRMGMEICEDAWNGIRPAQQHYINNVDIILNPSASNFSFGKSRIRERLVTEASRSYQCTYVYTNLLGNEAGRIIYDGEILIAQSGDLLARNRRFSFAEFDIVSAIVDVDFVHTYRKKSFNFEPQPPRHLICVPHTWEEADPQQESKHIEPLESKEQEFYLAETLALFDYMRKSKSRGFVLSLSGGADSSACGVLCAHAILRSFAELGESEWMSRVGYAQVDPQQPLVAQMLSCVYQSTENSSAATLESARELARGVGATFLHWQVEDIHERYVAMVEKGIGRSLTWEQDDLALQNIQARLRSPGVWMLANINRALLITTSNRSEAAVGYATMDGDTSGGLAPLGGMDKASLIAWLRWAEKDLDLPALAYVNALTPTAELRPDAYAQTDEADLMPYEILDQIEACAIRDYKSPSEVFRTLRGICPDKDLMGYIEKFFTLWARNQWKRERYAPSFHLDDKNLDPKTWCRFPILNGGFYQALEALTNPVRSVE